MNNMHWEWFFVLRHLGMEKWTWVSLGHSSTRRKYIRLANNFEKGSTVWREGVSKGNYYYTKSFKTGINASFFIQKTTETVKKEFNILKEGYTDIG